MNPKCQLCQGEMKESVQTKTGIAIVLLLVGLFLSITGIGAIIGIPMILVGLYFGGVKQGLWVCRDCGATAHRKIKSNSFRLR